MERKRWSDAGSLQERSQKHTLVPFKPAFPRQQTPEITSRVLSVVEKSFFLPSVFFIERHYYIDYQPNSKLERLKKEKVNK